ncbi:nuclease-related domain-containing protein [Alkalicoccus luteus]|uniref:NERD domain-containing protein n=1 Tax=Alkalicoccus luteus TaxID=1237094 RepID=A0A969TTA0_9BACI|nr:nuclease-related domain-containing protein [Alkalicoccus luteus]NJP37433.1 NERD domain-containing protein [Alkalicoccus luteus]
MLLNPRKKPYFFYQYEALLRRLPKTHPLYPRVEADFYRYRAGFSGEKELDYYFDYLPRDISYFHQLYASVPDSKFSVQIDLLLLSPTFISIIELKHYAGSLYFSSHYNQLVKTADGQSDVMACPLAQVDRQRIQLERILKHDLNKEIPILTQVFVTNPRCEIKSDLPIQNLAHVAKLPEIVRQWKTTYTEPTLTKSQITNLGKRLVNRLKKEERNLLSRYKLDPSILKSGVLCNSCDAIMARRRGYWVCAFCFERGKNQHQQAFRDYALLHKTTMTLTEAMNWAGMRRDTCGRLMQQQFKRVPSVYPVTYQLID